MDKARRITPPRQYAMLSFIFFRNVMACMRRYGGVLWLSLLGFSQAWAGSAADSFLAARAAYQAHDARALDAYASQLQAQKYLLAPYADYWRLLLRLDQANEQQVRAFLTDYEDLPFSERVRVEWLKTLGKREDWPTFFDELPRLAAEDASVACYAVRGRVAQGDEMALAQAKPLWMSATEQPANCESLFDRMVKAGALTEDDLWARFRLAMEQGKVSVAKSVLARLQPEDKADLKLLDKVYENPQRAIDKKTLTTRTHFGRELYLVALERLARAQPELALESWTGIKSAFSAEDQHYFWSRMALYAARRHDPIALEWFAAASDAPLSEEQHAWKARAALRVKNWLALQTAIAGMPASMQEDPAWTYWKGRALKEQGQTAAANALLLPLARERSYYGLLAEEELGPAIGAPPASSHANEEEVAAMARKPGIQRALELNRLDMRWEARNEWAWSRRSMDDRQLIAAAEVAFRNEWYDIAINTADKTQFVHDFALRYPTPYRETMQSYARTNGLDEAWVYGLIRQESRFITYAKSGVGASGLMQVMPATAKWIAKRIGLNGYHQGMMNQFDTNIQFGTHYLRYTLDEMGGQAVMATAAYNAGPGRAKRWAPPQPMEGAIYAETIPFSETRNYVQKVMSNAHYYAHRVGAKIQTLKQRLGLVMRGGSASGNEVEDAQTGGSSR